MRVPTGFLIAFLVALGVFAGCKGAGQALPTGVDCGGTDIASANGIWGGNYLHPAGIGSVVGFVQDDRGVFFRCVPNTNCNPGVWDALYATEINTTSRTGQFFSYSAIGPVETATTMRMNFTRCLNIQQTDTGLRQQPTMTLGRNDGLYNAPASLDIIAGTWSFSSGNEADGNAYSITLQIGETGALSGRDSDNCAYTGLVSVRNPGRNIYRFDDVVLSTEGSPGCVGDEDPTTRSPVPFDGIFQGLAIVNDVNNIGTRVGQLHLILANREVAFPLLLGR